MTRVLFFPGQERAVWHTPEQKEHSAARAGLRFKKQQERLESSPGEPSVRRRHGDGRRITRRGKRKERTRRTWMDMAGVKTFDLLVGVVLVLQCVRTVHAEITTSNGKKTLKLQHRVRCACTELRGATVAPRCQSQVESGVRISCKRALILHRKPKHAHMEPGYALKAAPTVMRRSPSLHLILIIFSRLVFIISSGFECSSAPVG